MVRTVTVGLGELKVSQDPQEVLIAYGLGSCVAVCIHDPMTGVAGMLHVLLPEANGAAPTSPARFADTGVPLLLAEASKRGAVRGRLVVKIVGGAAVLALPGAAPALQVGERNIQAVRAALARERLPLAAEDTGGTVGRTVQLFVRDGRVLVRTIGQGEREL